MNKKIIVIIVVVFLILRTALCIFLKKGEFNKNGKEIQKEVIFYGNSEMIQDNSSFENVVTLTWSTDDLITLVYPNGKKAENLSKPLTLSMNGEYTIKLDKITKKFKVEEIKVTDWEYNENTRTIKICNKNNITKAILVAELEDGTIFEGDLFDYIGKDTLEYTFPEKGYFEIQIETPGVKYNPIIINNE